MKAFDPIWDEIYESGHINRYPWDAIVTFVFRHRPADVAPAEVTILEVGCGAGNNIWFAAREGFKVIGVDASEQALAFARKRFADDRLSGEFHACSFEQMPLEDNSIDLVLDRAALTCTPKPVIERTVSEIHRVLKPGGKFLFIPYGDSHSSLPSGTLDESETTIAISDGSLTNVGQITFFSYKDILRLFESGWKFESIERMERTEMVGADRQIHAEYRVIVEKK